MRAVLYNLIFILSTFLAVNVHASYNDFYNDFYDEDDRQLQIALAESLNDLDEDEMFRLAIEESKKISGANWGFCRK